MVEFPKKSQRRIDKKPSDDSFEDSKKETSLTFSGDIPGPGAISE